MENSDLIILILICGIALLIVIILFKQIALKPDKNTLIQRLGELNRLYQELNNQVETYQIRIMEIERKHSELVGVCSEATDKTSDALITIEDAIGELAKPKTKSKGTCQPAEYNPIFFASKKGNKTGITPENILAEMKKNFTKIDIEKMRSVTLEREKKNAYRRIYRQLKKNGK